MNKKSGPQTYTVTIPEDKGGKRLDRLLADALPMLSRTRIKGLCATAKVVERTSGKAVKGPAHRVKVGDIYDVMVPAAAPAMPEPEDIPLEVLYEDEYLLVLNKPSGLVVHPAAGNQTGTLVNALLHHCAGSLSGIGGVGRPGIVHRLDKDTSGLMVVAKTDAAHQGLSKQFEMHSIERAYHALVWGVPSPRQGTITGNIGRSDHDRKKMAIVTGRGKAAVTHYTVLRAIGTRASLVECRLETGRTHQIRVHLTSLGHPLVGDPVYGPTDGRKLKGAPDELRAAMAEHKAQALHAYLLGFIHPVTGDALRFETEKCSYINLLISFLKKG